MLEIEGLTKRFGDKVAVDDVTLSFPPGQMVAVIGRSGAGKSTLLRLVNRLADPDAGDIRWDGSSVLRLKGRALRDWRRNAAMIFQQFHLAPRLDVLTNVLLGALHEAPPHAAMFKAFPRPLRARAILELDALDMADAALQRAGTLSGGQQQRVAIARAMMQSPKLVLADEPIASLDVENAERVMAELARINREFGITVIVNLHTLETARRWCTRVIGMAAGKVVFDGPVAGLDDAALDRIYRAGRPHAVMSERAPAAA